jgi:hypothetical protein
MKYLIIQQVSAEILPTLELFALESKLWRNYIRNMSGCKYFINANHIRLKSGSEDFVELI